MDRSLQNGSGIQVPVVSWSFGSVGGTVKGLQVSLVNFGSGSR